MDKSPQKAVIDNPFLAFLSIIPSQIALNCCHLFLWLTNEFIVNFGHCVMLVYFCEGIRLY